MATIYVPGKGNMDTTLLGIDRALSEYDDRLYLKFNEVQQEWCVFVKVPTGTGDDVPVLGLGVEKPHRDYVLDKIRSMDTKTYASKMLDMIDRHNEKIKAEQAYRFQESVQDHGEKLVSAALHNKINYKV